jgi:hypothetical protein
MIQSTQILAAYGLSLHSEFCILNYGRAGSISTAILRHLPCLKRMTLSAARVK